MSAVLSVVSLLWALLAGMSFGHALNASFIGSSRDVRVALAVCAGLLVAAATANYLAVLA